MKARTWTPENDAILAEFVAAKKSASEAGAKIGVSRNSCIGRAGRIGLVFDSPKSRPFNRPFKKPAAEHPKPIPQPLPPSAPEPLHISIEAIKRGQCYWPCEDPMLFCGHATENGHSWCSFHRSIGKVPDVRKAKA